MKLLTDNELSKIIAAYHNDDPACIIAMDLRELRRLAKAVVDRWDGPTWKDLEPTAVVVNRLRNAMPPPESTGEQ